MLPDLSVLPFMLPSVRLLGRSSLRLSPRPSLPPSLPPSASWAGAPRSTCLPASESRVGAQAGVHTLLQATLGSDGVMLLQRLGVQRASEGQREEAIGLLTTALTMVASGMDRARSQLVLGQTLAYFDRHEQALASFDAANEEAAAPSTANSDYIDFDIVTKQIEIDVLHLQRCAAHALSLCALGRAQGALLILESGLPEALAAAVRDALSSHRGLSVPPFAQDSHAGASAYRVVLQDPWLHYALARVRVLLALHRPMDAIALLDALESQHALAEAYPETILDTRLDASVDKYVDKDVDANPGANPVTYVDESRGGPSRNIYHDIYLLRAAALLALHRPILAMAPLEARLALYADDPAALVLYGQALTSLGEPAFAVDRFEQALRVAPMFAPAYRYMASALVMQKLDQEALSCLRAARRLKPDWPEAWLDEAGIRLRRGELAKGFAAYEWREGARHAATHGAAFWNGDDALAGQSILILAEQGLGDTLHFIRYVPMIVAQAREVIVEVPEKLQSLLSAFGRRAGFSVITPADPRPTCERFTLLMSLPHAVNTRMETIPADIPYLGVDVLPQDRPDWPDRPDWAAGQRTRYRVGIVPAGNPAFANDAMRSMPLSTFAPLFAREDVCAVLLQAAPREADQQWADAHPEWIAQIPLEGDFSDTAKVIAQLDLVISVDTALAHLTGAMGLPVWILLPYIADWRWLENRSDSPWYPSARLFRQLAPRDWDSVVMQVCEAIDAKTAPPPRSFPAM